MNIIRKIIRNISNRFNARLPRPTTASIIRRLKRRLKTLGIVVVDTSVYQSTKSFRSVYDIVIMTGYVPGLACFFTVKYNGGIFSSFKFLINGQFSEGAREVVENDLKNLTRSPTGYESRGCDGSFLINTSTDYSHIRGTNRKIEYGVDFFRSFLQKCRGSLAEKISTRIHLWFVPEGSDEYLELKEKNGELCRSNSAHFNAKVLAKFPAGFFWEGQRP